MTSTRAKLDGGEVLDHRSLAGQSPDGDGHHRAREQQQAFGNHPDDPGDRGDGRVVSTSGTVEELGDEQESGSWRQRPGHGTKNVVDAISELGSRETEPPGGAGKSTGIGGVADPHSLQTAAARHDETAGEHRIAGRLQDRIGFSRQERLVDLEILGGKHGLTSRILALALFVFPWFRSAPAASVRPQKRDHDRK
jgi:hypothetical protein